MNYREMNIAYSYISHGGNNIADSFLNPVLQYTKEYKRSVGFFSSSVFDTVMTGIVSLARNGGKIKIIASPKLSDEDTKVILSGYEHREKTIDAFSKDFLSEIEKFSERHLQLLFELIQKNILDIKIAITEGGGIYHDKLGILKDFFGNTIVFVGSSNATLSGYRINYEKIRISKSWDQGADIIVAEEENEFDSLWSNTNPFVEVFEYTEVAKKHLIEVISRRSNNEHKNLMTYDDLRDYQKEAIQKWKQNSYHGFFVMATGTGKTWTAIFAAKELINNKSSLIVICAPYKHLVKQWEEDVKKVFSSAKIILVSSENPGWEGQIIDAIIQKKYRKDYQIVIISTIASFKMERFENSLKNYSGKKLLIVDEAHRFNIRPMNYNYMLGLSATPYSGSSAERGKELMEYFGGEVFSLPIEVALEKGFLVPYYYYPIYVHSTELEEAQFNKFTSIILSCFNHNGVCIDPDKLVKALRNRLRIIGMASEKQTRIDEIIGMVNENDHLVVYCGDGRIYAQNSGEEIRHIQSVKQVLTKHGYKVSQFTAQENMDERMKIVDSFNKGEISAMAAIRCLDEGINIPSIKSALILSSNDDYREFVQRRGRILRTYDGKEYAKIYDIIVLPSTNMNAWAKIEFKRFHEYAKLALNWEKIEDEFDNLLAEYNLNIEDIDVYDYEEMEGIEDE